MSLAGNRPISDTVTVTADGQTVVDLPKLLAKKHIQEMMRDIYAKTRIVPRRKRETSDRSTGTVS